MKFKLRDTIFEENYLIYMVQSKKIIVFCPCVRVRDRPISGNGTVGL